MSDKSTLTPQPARSGGLRALLIIVGVVVIIAGGLALLGQATSRTETSTETYQGIARVDLDLANASIQVMGGDEEVVVDQRVTSGLIPTRVRHEVSGDTLRLIMRCPPVVAFSCEAAFELRVPAGTELTGRTANGRIEIAGTDGPIDVGTSNGAINLAGVSGPLRATTSNGSINATELVSPAIDFRTSNGRIQIEASVPPDQITARTSNGRIEIALPADSPGYAVDVSTSNGDTQLDIRTDPASPQKIEARTSNGDIIIRYR